jgi:membrane-bound lytic murein transglycosylase A
VIQSHVTPTGNWLRPAAWTSAIRPSVFLLGLICLLSACAPGIIFPEIDTMDGAPTAVPDTTDDELTLKFVTFEDVPGWFEADLAGFLPIFLRSCETLAGKSPVAPMGRSAKYGTVGDWMGICRDAASNLGANYNVLRYFFESRLRPYLVGSKNDPVGMFTGYYEAELNGSWQPGGAYNVPLYARPDDIVSIDLGSFRPEMAGQTLAGRIEGKDLVPYPARDAITAGALVGRQLEIMWVNSHIDAFFLHIQGSGRVRMTDGSIVRLAYAGRNGQRYVAVGRELIAAGIIPQDQMSMQAIRAWMELNPVGAMALMNTNPSYVFFRVSTETDAVGAQGVPLTPGRSIAVDDDFIPYGLPMWLDITDPRDPTHETPLRRMVIPQDTGSAIKGPVRGDLFWGFGREAAAAAGVMQEKGSYYVFLPRTRDAITDQLLTP